MIELSKTDLEEIAARRYNVLHKVQPIIWLGCLMIIAGLLGLSSLADDATLAVKVLIACAIGIIALVPLFLYLRRQARYVREFIESCEDDPTFSYKPDALTSDKS